MIVDPDIDPHDVVTPTQWCQVCGAHRAGEADGQYGDLCPACKDVLTYDGSRLDLAAIGVVLTLEDSVAHSNERGTT